ncbi:hypothetical protein AB0N28_09205 [Streptomyces sp. NPDC051130]|uniref:hypothetical protein n=1 Tax=Streptomyces sp. NPDC051130 TaxID=3157223 RepID=UPI003439E526
MTTSTPLPADLAGPEAAPAAGPRSPARVTAAVLCALLGAGLTAGAAATAWSDHRAARRTPTAEAAYRAAASLWRNAPADRLLPPVLEGPGDGPGGADRTWTRVALAPAADCGPTALAADWRTALAPAGCAHVLRATYTDSTRSSLVSVGLVFTTAGPATMDGLRGHLPAPSAYGFTDAQRATWTASVVAGAPAVVYAVSAFADGRVQDAPQPAEEAARPGATGAPAQAGLGHEAKAVAGRIERAVEDLAAPPSPHRTDPEPAR